LFCPIGKIFAHGILVSSMQGFFYFFFLNTGTGKHHDIISKRSHRIALPMTKRAVLIT
jgi:hypothetical protein